ncbi:T-cell receptor beta variable [Clarias magur]|nr:T-cell receptor beta variable [Clarias magur]
MIHFLIFFSSTIVCFAGSGVCSVIQNPPDLIKSHNEFAEIKCAHTVKSYDQILWYKHSQDSGFTLMGYIFAATLKREPELEAKIKLSGNGRNNGSLTINNLTVSDSAVYFCAAYYTVL